ncbi:DUF998 domain-containing protein [Arthrobacter cryoconiti]|uniref:DUF998 domain-containing protein n=1 Tax=Arthrobacter cryoconiti TaxID=748907 RepID=A0ABV8QX44_9MICC|nr:DUF998 domain-containing protein [Arthrobacter cryoconiti]MCC9067437.1 DUF998 domain-containing protein [Arthrobacter cryoconiti]
MSQVLTVTNRPAGTSFPSRGKAGVLGAALLLVAPLQFLLFEQITAAAWREPGYSFYYNFISDLGVVNGPIVYQGRHVDSPVGWLIDFSFIALGVLASTGIMLLTRSLARGAHRTVISIFGILFGIGGVLVGVFPENSVELGHIIGAFLNIGLGNALLIAIGLAGHRHYGLPRWISRLVVASGVIGAAAMAGLVAFPVLFTGAIERTAAYPYMFGFALLAALALVNIHKFQPLNGK